ncbi:MAG: type II toxin-antitoxin system Phd/YefM family antitoxin [Acidobacteria bacterium]|nr:MAG: type II toxin-antitoxin system Phd/YefM family antitoxin [Acidobacteriota bacterium]
MKTISMRDLQKRIKDCVEKSQDGYVVVTRRGEPAALLIGVKGQDWEDIVLQTSRSFWKLIQRRRSEKTVPLQEARKRLGGEK